MPIPSPPDEPDDPTAWLGDPVGSHATGGGSVTISVPTARRDRVVISLTRARQFDSDDLVDAFEALSPRTARGLRDTIDDALAQVEEHASPGEDRL